MAKASKAPKAPKAPKGVKPTRRKAPARGAPTTARPRSGAKIRAAKPARHPAVTGKGAKPPAQPAARRAAPRRRKVHFDKKTLASIRAQLEVHRGELLDELEELEETAFNASQSEMSGEVSYDEDYADAGSFTFEREKDLSIANNVQDLIDKISRAIEKVDEGTYGICEVCGQPIEAARLKALPHALLCVKDKAAEERR